MELNDVERLLAKTPQKKKFVFHTKETRERALVKKSTQFVQKSLNK